VTSSASRPHQIHGHPGGHGQRRPRRFRRAIAGIADLHHESCGQHRRNRVDPFASNVGDPDSDLRLGSGSANSFDPANDMVFDFYTTNRTIYAYHERLRIPGTTYAAWCERTPTLLTTPFRPRSSTTRPSRVTVSSARGVDLQVRRFAVTATLPQP
jgi:hypothetical protein